MNSGSKVESLLNGNPFTIKQQAAHTRGWSGVGEAATPGSRSGTVAAAQTWRWLVGAGRLTTRSLTIDSLPLTLSLSRSERWR